MTSAPGTFGDVSSASRTDEDIAAPQLTHRERKSASSEDQELLERHRFLLLAYLDVIDQISGTKSPEPDGSDGGQPQLGALGRAAVFIADEALRLFSWMPLVEVFAEWRIRTRLGELMVAYRQRQLACALSGDRHVNFFEAAHNCQQLADTLSSWKRVTTLAKAGAATGGAIVLAVLGVDNLTAAVRRVIVVAGGNPFNLVSSRQILWFVPLILVATIAAVSFLKMRSLFARPGLDGNTAHSTEDDVFALLGRARKRDFPLDLVAVAFLMVVAIFGGIQAYRSTRSPVYLLVVALIACAISFALIRGRRKRLGH